MRPSRSVSKSESSHRAHSKGDDDDDDDGGYDDDDESMVSFKSTFIDISVPRAVLRRTKSSPDTDMHKSPMSKFFQRERDYVDNLRGRADTILSRTSTPHSSQSECAYDMSRPWHRGSGSLFSTGSSRSASSSSKPSWPTKAARTSSSSKGFARALATIEELPQQLEEALQETMVAAVTDIKGSCQELCLCIQETSGGERATQLAVERIGRIPDHIMNELSRTVAEVKEFIEARMDNFVLNQVVTEGGRSQESLVHEMSQIPIQVEEIAREVVDSAIDDSTHKAVAQMDRALAPLTHDSQMTEARNQVMASMPGAQTIRCVSLAAEAVAKVNVKDAIANVRGKPYTSSDNKNVADMIMTSKVEENKQLSRMKIVCPRATNSDASSSTSFAAPSGYLGSPPAPVTGKNRSHAGSIGHPEMCKKPCLFFQSGQCVHMANCSFCHLAHPHRASHLDKRNRDLLTRLQVGDRLQILIDALRSRAQVLPYKRAADRFVDILESACNPHLSDEVMPMRDQKTVKKLLCALQGQVFSSLISLFFKHASGLDSAALAKMNEARSMFEREIGDMDHVPVHRIALKKCV